MLDTRELLSDCYFPVLQKMNFTLKLNWPQIYAYELIPLFNALLFWLLYNKTQNVINVSQLQTPYLYLFKASFFENQAYEDKRPVKLTERVKTAHSFLQSVSDLFHFIILSLPM